MKKKEKVVKNKNMSTNSSNDINNPQSAVSVINSSTDNMSKNDEKIVINETKKIIAQKNTVILASINNGELEIKEGITLPPPVDLNKKEELVNKKTGKKIRVVTFRERIINFFLTIILFGVIGGIGYGTYYFMYMKNPANFNVKNITLELGDSIPNVASYYIDLKDISDLDYVLDISKVENKLGTYQYSVSYGKTKKFGTINIIDTKYPTIIFSDNLKFNLGDNITKETLVKECNDPSNCTYDLVNEIDTTKPGKVSFSIKVTDDLGNTNIYTNELEIIEVTYKLVCTKNSLDASLKFLNKEEFILNFDGNKMIVSNNYKYTKTYFSDTLFNEEKNNDPNAIIDEETKSIIISKDYLDFNGMKNYDVINSYLIENGYTCS